MASIPETEFFHTQLAAARQDWEENCIEPSEHHYKQAINEASWLCNYFAERYQYELAQEMFATLQQACSEFGQHFPEHHADLDDTLLCTRARINSRLGAQFLEESAPVSAPLSKLHRWKIFPRLRNALATLSLRTQ